MRFEILGPLRVRVSADGEGEVTLPAGRERTLLAMLLLHANHTVPTTQLIDAIWPADAPPGARNQLQGCVSRLRRRLTSAGALAQDLNTDPVGYRLTVTSDRLDLLEFRRLVTRARDAVTAGQQHDSVEAYRAALALWRGRALTGIDSDAVADAATALDEERAVALEERLEVELDDGAAEELVAELTDLVRQHPHREGLHRALMLALYRAGRQPDALAAYRRAHRLLRDELGIEPGAELQRLHQAVLERARSLDAPPRPEPAPASTRSVPPRELPAAGSDFTGRAEALRTLDGLLAPGSSNVPAPVAISAIAGTAGVGKTALAVHWAHRVADRFPDGQLFADLRGYSTGSPRRPAEVLSVLLRSLGTPPEQIPTEEEQAAVLYRTKLADRRVLVVLDNAATADQVRPLLPASSGSFVLVTSRDRLDELVALDGAALVTLDVLLPDEAQALLVSRLGSERVQADTEAAASLARACAHLPLALRVAAANLEATPQRTIAEYLCELTGDHRLATLRVDGDEETAVQLALDRSYQRIPGATQRVFRLLGLAPGPDFTARAAAALADSSPTEAARQLRQLARAHLIEETAPGRYRFHDLLRIYAKQRLLATPEEAGERMPAIARLFDHYLHSAHTAAALAYPATLQIPLSGSSAGCRPEVFDKLPAALAWLTSERPNLVAAVVHAAEHGPRAIAWQLAGNLRAFLGRQRYTMDWIRIADAALAAADVEADPFGRALAHLILADLQHRVSRYQESAASYTRAAQYADQAGWMDGQAAALGNLGTVRRSMGQLLPAAECYANSTRLFQRAGRPGGEAINGGNLGLIYYELGRLSEAAEQLDRALVLYQQVGDHGAAFCLSNLACVYHELGHFDQAYSYASQALRLQQEIWSQAQVVAVQGLMAEIHGDAGRLDAALECAQAAASLALELGDPVRRALSLNNLGSVQLRRGEAQQALDLHQEALTLARETGYRTAEVAALLGLAEAGHRLSHWDTAYDVAGQCLTLAAEVGYRVVEGRALTCLAEIRCCQGLLDHAIRYAHQALDTHRETGHRLGEARTLAALGQIAKISGQAGVARRYWGQAVALYTAVGAPVPEDIRATGDLGATAFDAVGRTYQGGAQMEENAETVAGGGG